MTKIPERSRIPRQNGQPGGTPERDLKNGSYGHPSFTLQLSAARLFVFLTHQQLEQLAN